MGLLETIRDVLAIVRDLLLIAFLVAALFGVVNVTSVVSKLKQGPSAEGAFAVPENTDGKEPTSFTGFGSEGGPKYDGEKIIDPALQALYQEARDAFKEGNNDRGLDALDRLADALDAKGLANEVNIVRNLQAGIRQQDETRTKRYGSLLESMFEG